MYYLMMKICLLKEAVESAKCVVKIEKQIREKQIKEEIVKK
jgi:hypothetical protein